jgi:hypothetical protein
MTLLTITADYSGEDSTDDQETIADALEKIAARLRDYDWVMGDRYPVCDDEDNTIGHWETQPSPPDTPDESPGTDPDFPGLVLGANGRAGSHE